MKNTLRIIASVFLLLGGAFFFRTWVVVQFNNAVAVLDTSFPTQYSVASVVQSVSSASSSPSVLSTPEEVYTGPDNFNFVRPEKNTTLYQGCTYPVAWTASSTVRTVTFSLVDAGTQKALSDEVSNLPKGITGDSLKNVSWKVGLRVWPGEYFLKMTMLNNKEVDEKSYRFRVDAFPVNIEQTEQQELCKKTGGVL